MKKHEAPHRGFPAQGSHPRKRNSYKIWLQNQWGFWPSRWERRNLKTQTSPFKGLRIDSLTHRHTTWPSEDSQQLRRHKRYKRKDWVVVPGQILEGQPLSFLYQALPWGSLQMGTIMLVLTLPLHGQFWSHIGPVTSAPIPYFSLTPSPTQTTNYPQHNHSQAANLVLHLFQATALGLAWPAHFREDLQWWHIDGSSSFSVS